MRENSLDDLWRGFVTPPDGARPRAWWHWLDGDVDPEGIRLDLEWLHRVGVRGVQLFEGGMGTPPVVPQRVVHGSPPWRAAVRLASDTAERLGLELAVATSAGWSAAGGPWVRPADAMKKVVWSTTAVLGGRRVEVPLSPLPDVAGPYQDCARWGADPGQHRHAQDWVTLAVPTADLPVTRTPDAVRASAPLEDWSCLVDGRFSSAVALPRDPGATSTAWLEQVFHEPVEVAAVTVGLPGPRGFGAAPPPEAALEFSPDGVAWQSLADLGEVVVPAAKAVPVRTASFPAVRARRFRLVLTGPPAADALPRLAPGVTLPPVLRPASEFLVSEFALWSGGIVHRGEVKAGYAAALDEAALDVPTGATGVAPESVLDLTAYVDGQGTLRWDAPPGRWTVLRLGASPTGQTNGPAPPEATGLEVDKLDPERVRGYLATWLARFDGLHLGALLSDSIESGPQNVTDRLREEFQRLRGYDPLPWLPALCGFVVGDAARSDRFLWDYRRTIADLLSTGYYATLAAEAHARGLTYYAEALEDHRPQLGDDLAMRSHADVPMGAMWVYDTERGAPAPTYVADLQGASSVAHVHGKRFTGAESLTSFHRPWSDTPRTLKPVADRELALGVTRFCIHTSPHQAVGAPPPGIGLSPYLGQAFVRTLPWAELAGPWVDYLARCSWLLAQGVPSVDVAVLVGEGVPVTALYAGRPFDDLPPGVGHDFVNADALETRLRVVDGELVAGDVGYRLLLLGRGTERLTVRTLRRVADLVDAGATVVGSRPQGSPSLADDDHEHQELCASLWGAGRILDALPPLSSALSVDGGEVLRIGRRTVAGPVEFLANPHPAPATLTVSWRSGSVPVAWDPVEVRRKVLEPAGTGPERRHRLRLPAYGSVFLVEGGTGSAPLPDPRHRRVLDGAWSLRLGGAGEQEIALPGDPRPWTEAGGSAAGATRGTYRTVFDLPEVPTRALLRLGDVGDVAAARVNGADLGVTWTVPFHLDVTGALAAGRNVLEVEVATAWMNRLVVEASSPSGELFAPVTGVYAPDAPLRPGGLTGPVVLDVW